MCVNEIQVKRLYFDYKTHFEFKCKESWNTHRHIQKQMDQWRKKVKIELFPNLNTNRFREGILIHPFGAWKFNYTKIHEKKHRICVRKEDESKTTDVSLNSPVWGIASYHDFVWTLCPHTNVRMLSFLLSNKFFGLVPVAVRFSIKTSRIL